MASARVSDRVQAAVALLLLCAASASAASVGVCWGRDSFQPYHPAAVVSLLEANNIPRIRIFDANAGILRALIGHKMEVAITLPNALLQTMAASPAAALAWVRVNVQPYILSGVNIKQLAVGNEPFLTAYNGAFNNFLVPALQNMRQALFALGLDLKVKLTVPFSADVLASSFPPSSGAFRPDIVEQVKQVAGVLRATGSVFVINVSPFFTLLEEGQRGYVQPSMVLIDTQASTNIEGPSPGAWNYVDPLTGLRYGNTFDGTFDAAVFALRRINFNDLPIEVGAVGWPSEGDNNATLHYATPYNAAVFNNAVIAHMLSGAGTPARPNTAISGFLLALTDEDNAPIQAGPFARHWGIYRSDGTPKYNVDFTGGLGGQTVQGYVKFQKALSPAYGVTLLPQRWCVSKPGTTQKQYLDILSYLCSGNNRVDCTTIMPGGTCFLQNNVPRMVDYIMNNFYQLNGQNPNSCYFSNNAGIVTVDPSGGGCKFQLGIM